MTYETLKFYCNERLVPNAVRREILNIKRDDLVNRMNTIQDSIDCIDSKQDSDSDVLGGKIEYRSNLTE